MNVMTNVPHGARFVSTERGAEGESWYSVWSLILGASRAWAEDLPVNKVGWPCTHFYVDLPFTPAAVFLSSSWMPSRVMSAQGTRPPKSVVRRRVTFEIPVSGDLCITAFEEPWSDHFKKAHC